MGIEARKSRRSVLLGGGTLLAAAGLAALEPGAGRARMRLPEVGAWPWPKGGLDPVRTAGAAADDDWHGCGVVSFGLIVEGLKRTLPRSAWPALPPQLASFANGGGPYGSDCGALQGPLLVMNLLGAPPELRQELYKWYCEFPFPSRDWDHLYPFKGTVTSVSRSPLCHQSRAIWEGVYLREAYDGKAYDGTRCAKLPRDCVRKAVELVNAWTSSGYRGSWAPDPGSQACYDCHTRLYKDKQPGGIHSGKADCGPCHAAVPEHGGPGPSGS